jgi:hypothetical protein
MPQTFEGTIEARLGIEVGTVRIARLVRDSMMTPVVCGPNQRRPLTRHRSGSYEKEPKRAGRLKRPMGQETVIASRYTKPRDCAHDREYREIRWSYEFVPKQHDRTDNTEKRCYR